MGGATARIAETAIDNWVPRGDVFLLGTDQALYYIFKAVKDAVVPALLLELVSPELYQWMISFVRSCVLVSIGVSSLLGQFLHSRGMGTAAMLKMSLVGQSLAVPCIFLLPHSVGHADKETSRCDEFRTAAKATWATLTGVRRSKAWFLLCWYLSNTASGEILQTYYQRDFRDAAKSRHQSDDGSDLNGLVSFLAYLVATTLSLGVSHRSVEPWLRRNAILLAPFIVFAYAAMLASLGGAALGWPTWPLGFDYACFVVGNGLFEVTRTMCLAQLALMVREQGCSNMVSFLVLLQRVSGSQVLLQVALQRMSAAAQTIACGVFMSGIGVVLSLALTVLSCCGHRFEVDARTAPLVVESLSEAKASA